MLTKNLKLIATGISIALITTACASKQSNSTLNTRLEFEKALDKAPKFRQKLANESLPYPTMQTKDDLQPLKKAVTDTLLVTTILTLILKSIPPMFVMI